MPKKPKRPCSYPGCPRLADGQYCGEHSAVARKQYDKYERSADVNKKYGRAWKRIRDRHITQHPLCERCQEEGRLVPAEEVHHIVRLSPDNIWDTNITLNPDNLISLCKDCHFAEHKAEKEAGKYKANGKSYGDCRDGFHFDENGMMVPDA